MRRLEVERETSGRHDYAWRDYPCGGLPYGKFTARCYKVGHEPTLRKAKPTGEGGRETDGLRWVREDQFAGRRQRAAHTNRFERNFR